MVKGSVLCRACSAHHHTYVHVFPIPPPPSIVCGPVNMAIWRGISPFAADDIIISEVSRYYFHWAMRYQLNSLEMKKAVSVMNSN